MSEIGDAVEIVFSTNPGATVVVDVYNGSGTKVIEADPVPESGTSAGQYPYVFVGDSAGVWQLVFTASGTAVAVETYSETFEVVPGPAPLATVADYIGIYGTVSAVRETVLRALLRRASQLVRDNFPLLDSQIAAGTIPPGNPALAVLNMAVRVMRNPAGLRSEATGPFSRSYDPAAASGLLELTGSETGLLIPPVGAGRKQRPRTVRVTGGLVPAVPPSRSSQVYPGRGWPPWPT